MIKFTHGVRGNEDTVNTKEQTQKNFEITTTNMKQSIDTNNILNTSDKTIMNQIKYPGGIITNVYDYNETIGNPFNTSPSICWSDDVIDLIVTGGATKHYIQVNS